MATIVKTRIQFRRDTAANWLLYKDVVPYDGEPCFEIDTGVFKIGDGITTYENLEPVGGVVLSADGKSVVLEDGVFKLVGFDAAEVGAQPRKNADGNIEWVVPSTETVDGLKSTVAGLQSDVKTLQELVGSGAEGEGTLLTRIEAIEDDYLVKADKTELQDQIITNANAIKTLMDGIDPKKVDGVKDLISYVEEHGAEVSGMKEDITSLRDLVGNTSVQDQIEAATASKVDKVEGMGLSSNDFTDSLLGKLKGIEDGAQINAIEKISIGGSILDVVDKAVNIPVASLDRAGVVKSATGANKVNISNDGVMSVNKVSVSSLFVPIGDELVLDGGSASKETPVYPTRIGDVGYDSIKDAVNCADNGDVITLQEDVNMGTGDNDNLVVSAENVTINLGGKVLTANGSNGAVKVEGGVTTLDGEGTVSGTLGSDNYSMAVWASSGTVVINDGIYKNETDNSARGTDLIYASGTGCIEINGGTFEAAKPEWTLNVKDADYKAGTAKIIVKGGSFKGFDPANNNSEGTGTNFVADGYKSVLEGEYYVVKPI